MTPRPTFVILAAGHSRRLGKPKALARVRGVSLLRRTADLLAPLAGAALLVVVPPRAARYRHELRGHRVRLCVNPRRSEGLATSVRLGVARARHACAVLILPVDLAALSRRDVARLIGRWRAARRRLVARRLGAAGTAARGAAPLILPKRLYHATLELQGDAGLKDFVAALAAPDLKLIDLPSAAADVDTRADLATARRRWSRPC